MKPINVKNIEKLNDAINEAEGRATVRTISATYIAEMLAEVEKHLSIPKKHMVGIVVSCDPNAQHFAKAYKYTPVSTQFAAEYRPSGWFVTNVTRERCGVTRVRIYLTDDAKKAVVANKEYMA